MADEYIKREDAVIKAKQAVFATFRYGKTPTENAVYENIDIAFKEQYLPSADVAEVRHGKWIVSEDDNKIFGCSECHHVVFGKPNYCSRCGARMDGE